MPVERKPVGCFHMIGGTPEDNARFAEQDFLVRSGMCPNGCGLMAFDGTIQTCGSCKFSTNCKPELEQQ